MLGEIWSLFYLLRQNENSMHVMWDKTDRAKKWRVFVLIIFMLKEANQEQTCVSFPIKLEIYRLYRMKGRSNSRQWIGWKKTAWSDKFTSCCLTLHLWLDENTAVCWWWDHVDCMMLGIKMCLLQDILTIPTIPRRTSKLSRSAFMNKNCDIRLLRCLIHSLGFSSDLHWLCTQKQLVCQHLFGVVLTASWVHALLNRDCSEVTLGKKTELKRCHSYSVLNCALQQKSKGGEGEHV